MQNPTRNHAPPSNKPRKNSMTDDQTRDLMDAAWRVVQAIRNYPPSVGEDDDERVPIALGDLKGLRRAVQAVRPGQ